MTREERINRIRERVAKMTPDELLTKLESYPAAGPLIFTEKDMEEIDDRLIQKAKETHEKIKSGKCKLHSQAEFTKIMKEKIKRLKDNIDKK